MHRTHSLEDREVPICPTCGIKMQWWRSELVRFVPVTNLHLFNCPTCFLLAESETVDEPVCVSPDKLTVAGFRFFCPGGIKGQRPAAERRAQDRHAQRGQGRSRSGVIRNMARFMHRDLPKGGQLEDIANVVGLGLRRHYVDDLSRREAAGGRLGETGEL